MYFYLHRSYSKFRKAEWEMDYTYCERLLDQKRTYLYPRFIKDLVDSHIFDFITGNVFIHSLAGSSFGLFSYAVITAKSCIGHC